VGRSPLDNQKQTTSNDPSASDAGTKDPRAGSPAARSDGGRAVSQTVDEFFQNLKPELRRPKPSDEAVAAARLAIERLEMQSMSRESLSGHDGLDAIAGLCRLCGRSNSADSQFCGGCGVPLDLAGGPAPGQGAAPNASGHQYHHHYHHHFLSGGMEGGLQSLLAGGGAVRRDPARPSVATPALSRAESGIRKLTQDWALACNTKHLEDLVDLYSTDGMVLRSNYPPVRGTSAIREFFVHLLEGGLGDVELESLKVMVGSDLAFEAGRCKMLVPTAMGKRREERGKYVMIYGRQPSGEWKAVVDCWSSDLGLTAGTEVDPARPPGPVPPGLKIPRRSA
jgi:ketosteroid isomerase-like protein